MSEAPPVNVGAEVGEGVWAVGDEIQPGTYTTEAPQGDVLDSCYWARVSGFSGELADLITNGIVEPGSHGRFDVLSSDAGVVFTGECTGTGAERRNRDDDLLDRRSRRRPGPPRARQRRTAGLRAFAARGPS